MGHFAPILDQFNNPFLFLRNHIFFRIDLNHIHDQVCIETKSKDIKEVVGTFKNGILEGIAKIKTEDGQVKIANFRNGMFYGLQRKWDSDGNLTEIAYYNQFKMSSSWTKVNNFLVFDANDGLINLHKDPVLDLIFDLKTNETFVGHFLKQFNILENVFKVEVLDEIQKDSCLLRPQWKNEIKMDFVILLNSNKKMPLKNQCIIKKNPEETFTNWYKSFFLDEKDTGAHNLWKLSQSSDTETVKYQVVTFLNSSKSHFIFQIY